MEIFTADFWEMLIDPEKYRAMAAGLGPWAPALGVAIVIVISFLPLPMQMAAVANGIVFGRIAGFVLTYIGAVAAAFLAFWIARALGRPFVNRFTPAATLTRFQHLVDRRGGAFLILARVFPVIPFTIVNYGSGLSPVSWRAYAATSAIGLAPPVLVFTSVGALMGEAPLAGWIALGAIVIACAVAGYFTRGWWLAAPSERP